MAWMATSHPPLSMVRCCVVLLCATAPPLATGLNLLGELRARKLVLVDDTSRNQLREVTLARGGRLNAIDVAMLEALEAAVDNSPHMLITSVDSRAFCAGGDVRALATAIPNGTAAQFLRREYSLLESIRSKPTTVAVADGLAFGMGAGLFLAARRRIVTQSATLATPECRIGLCPDAGALSFLRRQAPPALALWLAATGARINAHDCVDLGLATDFVRRGSDSMASLLDELKIAPLDELDVVVERRCDQPDAGLATPLLGDAVAAALERIFQDGPLDFRSLVAKLDAEREAARRALGSFAWQTREQAEGVLEILDAGHEALTRDSCPLAVETALAAVSTLDAADSVRAHVAELVINTNLAARPTFQRRVQAKLEEGESPVTPEVPPPSSAAFARSLVAAAQTALDDLCAHLDDDDDDLEARLEVLRVAETALARGEYRVELPP